MIRVLTLEKKFSANGNVPLMPYDSFENCKTLWYEKEEEKKEKEIII